DLARAAGLPCWSATKRCEAWARRAKRLLRDGASGPVRSARSGSPHGLGRLRRGGGVRPATEAGAVSYRRPLSSIPLVARRFGASLGGSRRPLSTFEERLDRLALHQLPHLILARLVGGQHRHVDIVLFDLARLVAHQNAGTKLARDLVHV